MGSRESGCACLRRPGGGHQLWGGFLVCEAVGGAAGWGAALLGAGGPRGGGVGGEGFEEKDPPAPRRRGTAARRNE